MSKMLEQAILDAEQLKEAAIKNAESALLEKYSDQIRSAVDSILEDDDVMVGDELPIGLPTEKEANCGCPGAEQDLEIPIDTLLGEPVADEVEIDFETGREEAPLQEQVEDLDEEIEIDLDALLGESEIPEERPESWTRASQENAYKRERERLKPDDEEDAEERRKTKRKKRSWNSSPSWSSIMEEEELVELEESLLNSIMEEEELVELEESLLNSIIEEGDDENEDENEEDAEAAEEDAEGMAAAAAALQEQDVVDVIVDALVDTVAEHLKVDYDPVPGGYSDWTRRDAGETQEAFLARTKDTEIAEDQKEYQDAYKALEGLPMLQENLNKLETKNEKYKEAILYLKEKLEEVNLSNAILLYTNRTLGSDSLNERQKTKIVEAISKAGSVNEAKTIFETLQSTIESSRERRQPKSLSEAVKRKSSLYLPRRQEKVDTNDILKQRMMRLAGINK